jgi:hypothetical protein
MKYLLMVYFDGAQERMAQLSADEQADITQEFVAFFQSSQIRDGNQLQPPATATTVRDIDGEPVRTPGPFPGASGEPLGGYYLVEADDLDAAAAIAARIPAVRMGAAIEVRPVIPR